MERRSKKLIKELRTSLKLQNSGASSGLQKDENEFATNPDGYAEELNQGSPSADGPSSKAKESKSNVDDDDDDFGYDPERYVPIDEKVEFSDNIKKVTKEGLTQIINYLKEKQPDAIDDLGNDRLQIKIDMIEREAFNHCKEILNLNIKEAPSKRQKTGAFMGLK